MDYEEKYENALPRAKNLHKDAIDMEGNLSSKQCETIFPELAEKKEPKKIEDEPKNYKQQLMSEMADLVKDYIRLKSSWSEEDEDMCYKATAVINKLCAEGREYVWSVNTLKKLLYWLKSLKQRIIG